MTEAVAVAPTAKPKSKSIFSISCGASVFMVMYMGMAMFNIYGLMNPLYRMDLKQFPPNTFIGPYWKSPSNLFLRIYLSPEPKFTTDFMHEEKAMLLWESEIEKASLSKSFLLCTKSCPDNAAYQAASSWLDEAENKEEGLLAELKAGEGIESTSILLVAYEGISTQLTNLMRLLGLAAPAAGKKAETNEANDESERLQVSLPDQMFSKLHSNSTLYAHILLTTNTLASDDSILAVRKAAQSNSLLLDKVNLVKYEPPHHVDRPKRILVRDLQYILGMGDSSSSSSDGGIPPWDMSKSQPTEYGIYQELQTMKAAKIGYPYWKPEISVKYIYDPTKYPQQLASSSGMQLVQVKKSNTHPTGVATLPGLHVDEIGLTSEKYLPVNATLTALPLRVNFDRSDVEDDGDDDESQKKKKTTTATAGGMSPARWRLLTHLSQSIESQKELGFEQSDIDDLRRLIADTNVALLGVTVLASGLHLLFEFLTFKNEVSFWQNNKDLTGLSVRSLFLDMIGQLVILLFLIEKDSSLLMVIPTAVGCLIALWKCNRGAGFKFLKVDPSEERQVEWWNRGFRLLIGYELRATRLEIANKTKEGGGNANTTGGKDRTAAAAAAPDLRELTIETDRIATRSLGSILLPFVIGYTIYSFIYEEHAGWYSWLITSASSAVYALGFALMTPQLFLNYKLKSVAHLPWRVLVYKFLNTFIDDLFAFIIRMPTMARLSCFRDDIVFIIYLYQRWLYPVDQSRPVEGGGGGAAGGGGGGEEPSKKKTE